MYTPLWMPYLRPTSKLLSGDQVVASDCEDVRRMIEGACTLYSLQGIQVVCLCS